MGTSAVKALATPELDKRSRVAFGQERPADTLTNFYDWLAADGIVLARYGEPYEREERCPDCPTIKGYDERAISYRARQVLSALRGDEHARYADEITRKRSKRCPGCRGVGVIYHQQTRPDVLYPAQESPERLFARFFDINLAAIDAEQRALLEAIRADD